MCVGMCTWVQHCWRPEALVPPGARDQEVVSTDEDASEPSFQLFLCCVIVWFWGVGEWNVGFFWVCVCLLSLPGLELPSRSDWPWAPRDSPTLPPVLGGCRHTCLCFNMKMVLKRVLCSWQYPVTKSCSVSPAAHFQQHFLPLSILCNGMCSSFLLSNYKANMRNKIPIIPCLKVMIRSQSYLIITRGLLV